MLSENNTKNPNYTSIIRRLKKLEQAVFSGKFKKVKSTGVDVKEFGGTTGGVRLLISRGFFKMKKNLSEIRAELEKHGYHYSSQAIDMALRRLSKLKGPLVVLRQGRNKRNKLYCERK